MSKFYKANPQPHSQPSQPQNVPQAQKLPLSQEMPAWQNKRKSQVFPSAQIPLISSSSHPTISVLHLLLKVLPILIYTIFPIFTDSFLIKEVVVIVAGIDFWIVKNITGRLLVGLRWWVDFQENGDEKWKFQCKVNQGNLNAADQRIFWWGLGLGSLVWLVFAVGNVVTLGLTNLVICLFCLVMIGFNLYSYYRCSKAQSENVKKLAMQYGAGVAAKFMYGSIVANYF